MLFKNAFHLLVDNFKLNYKYLLYKIVVSIIVLGLSAALLYPTLKLLFNSAQFEAIVTLLRDFFKALTSGDVDYLRGFGTLFQNAVADFAVFVGEKTPNIVFFSVSLILIVLVAKFLSGMGNFAFGCLIDNKMSSYAKTSFYSAFIGNMGRAALWSVVYVPITFLYDAAVLALCYVVFLFLLNVISFGLIAAIAAMMVSVALLITAQAVKLTVFNDAVPAFVVDKMSLRGALKQSFSFSKERFSNLFSTYLFTCLLILCGNVLFGVSTFGAGLFITIPMSYLAMICIQFVSYYTYGKRKYFLGKDVIVYPKEKTLENFYDNFDM